MKKSKVSPPRRGWVVGVNAPGYLPDSEPVVYSSFDAAWMGLVEELVRTRESLYDDNPHNGADKQLQEATDAACDQVKNYGNVPFSILAFDLVHWIERAY